jgi:hypothetical protein
VFRDQFIAQGSALAAAICVSAALVQRKIGLIYKLKFWQYISFPLLWLVAILGLAFMFAAVFSRFSKLIHLVESVANRMTILFYIYIFLGGLSLVVVAARNIFP